VSLTKATSKVLFAVYFKRNLPELQLEHATAQTMCEIALPLSFCTMANHAFLEVFPPERGRVARTGSPLFSHMVVAERFNKHLRSLLKQYKTPAKHLMISTLRENMIEIERIIQPPGYFVSDPPKSSYAGAVQSGAFDEVVGPDYIRVERVVRMMGKLTSKYLTPTQSDALHEFFLLDQPVYREAHRKLAGTHMLMGCMWYNYTLCCIYIPLECILYYSIV
jgi:hypothetical protein